MSTHPIDCFCPHCVQDVRGQADAAQAQTLRIIDDLERLRCLLRTLQKTVDADCDTMVKLIEAHLGPTRNASEPPPQPSPVRMALKSIRQLWSESRWGRKEHRR